VSPQAAVVVDGAGFPKSLRMGCSHSVTWYARMLATSFHAWLLESAISMREALAGRLPTWPHSTGIDAISPPGLHRPPLPAGEHHPGRSDEITDRRLDDWVERRLRAFSQDRVGECDAAGELLAVRRATVEAGRNVPGGFWCCQNEPEAAEYALAGKHALSDLRGAILATDGATRGLHLLPGTHDLDGLVTRVLDGAHSSIFSEIRAAERAASAVLSARAVKVHDDATLVSLCVPGERMSQRGAIRRL
jgi:hypothetical protein